MANRRGGGRSWIGLVCTGILAIAFIAQSSGDRANAAGSQAAATSVDASTPCAGAPAPPKWRHVVVLLFENQYWSDVVGATGSNGNLVAPYVTGLVSKCGTSFGGGDSATPKDNWHNANYDVAGNYLDWYDSKASYAVLTNGQKPSATGIVDDTYEATTGVDNIFNEARLAGLVAGDYYDGPGSSTPCASDNFSGSYHDAIRFYTNVGGESADPNSYCNTHDKPLTAFWSDLNNGALPAFSLILPTNSENMHNSADASVIGAGDSWAANFLPQLLNSAQYRSGDTAVFFLWDEYTPIPNVLIAPSVVPGSRVTAPTGNPISHYAALRTFEEMLGLPLIGDTSKAPSLLDFFNDCANGSCIRPNPPPDTTPPTAPSGLAATRVAAREVDLAWTASTDDTALSGYRITRNKVVITTVGATATGYNDTSVSPSTGYTYSVTAFDTAGNVSQPSNTLTLTTPAAPDTTPPTAPRNLKASTAGSSQIALSWTASKDNVGVSGYDVYRAISAKTTGPFALVASLAGTSTTYRDGSLSRSTRYTYYVQARDAAGNTSPASNQASATTKAR